MLPPEARTQILALLDWLNAMGADCATEHVAQNWLAHIDRPPGADFNWPLKDEEIRENAAPTHAASTNSPVAAVRPPVAVAARTEPRQAAPRPHTPLAASEAESSARRVAQGASSLKALEAELRAFDGCALKATATNLCFYRGAPTATLMLIGEAPGREEDLEGRPFVGRAGQLLDKILAAIGLTETDVHITNVVYWRPPGNRTPTPQETLACKPFLERQIELVAPKIVVALGGAAAKEVLGETQGIMRLRGKWREAQFGGHTAMALATLHPAYLLRTPAAKQLAWLDMLHVKSRL